MNALKWPSWFKPGASMLIAPMIIILLLMMMVLPLPPFASALHQPPSVHPTFLSG